MPTAIPIGEIWQCPNCKASWPQAFICGCRPRTRLGVARQRLRRLARDLLAFARDGFRLVSSREYRRRLDVCRGCDRYVPRGKIRPGFCKECGCAMVVKAWGAAWDCPLKKW